MDSRPGKLLLVGLFLALGACGTSQASGRSHGMLSIASHVPAEQRWAYLQTSLTKEGWQIERSDRAKAEMVAFKADADMSDLRERLVVKLSADTSAAKIQSEVRVADGWKSSPGVCRSYTFAREKQIIGGMETFLAENRADNHRVDLH